MDWLITRTITIKIDDREQRNLKTDQTHGTFNYDWDGQRWTIRAIRDSSPAPLFGSRPTTPKWIKKLLRNAASVVVLHDRIERSLNLPLDNENARQLLAGYIGTPADFPEGATFARRIDPAGGISTDSVVFVDSNEAAHNKWVSPEDMDVLAKEIGFSFPEVTITRPALVIV